MREVANEYKDVQDKTRYQFVAERFRLPFWDSYMPRNEKTVGQGIENVFGVPKILQTEEVFVHHYNKDFGLKIEKPALSIRLSQYQHLEIQRYGSLVTNSTMEEARTSISWKGNHNTKR